MGPVDTLARWARYLLGKRGELRAMGGRDAYMARAILHVHRARRGKRIARVPLAALEPIHGIDRESALRTVRERADALRARRAELLAARVLDAAALEASMPSVSAIKVVRDGARWLAFEGNGRLYAMREVFAPSDAMEVEVEEYLFDDDRGVLRRLRRVRRLNGLA